MKKTNKQLVRGRNKRSVLPIACVGLLGLTLPAMAQYASEYESTQPSPEAEAAPAGQLRWGVGLGHRLESDMDKGGKSDETAIRTTLAGNYKVSDQVKLGVAMSYQFSHYNFSGNDLSDTDIHIVRVTPLLQYMIDEKWSVYGGPSGAFSGESGADFGDAVTGGGVAGFNYRANESVTVGAGLGIFSQIEDDARLVPILTLNWKIDENWGVKVGFTEVAANGGLGAELNYDFGNDWQLGIGVASSQKRVRLEDGTVAQDRNVPIYAKLAWKACDTASLELVGGIATGGQYKVYDSDGTLAGQSDYDSGALIGLRAMILF